MSFNQHSITGSLSRSPVVTNQDDSKRYWKRLEKYFSEKVMGPGPNSQFCCEHEDACCSSAERKKGYSFHPGQLSYVGDGYAAEIGGIPMRILVVPMQVGSCERIDMARRHEQVLERILHPGKDGNKHMPGVIQVLQVLMGLDPYGDVEKIDDGNHVLKAYAMANSVLCSKLKPGRKRTGRKRSGSPTDDMLTNCREHKRSGSPTGTMLTNCQEHLRQTIVLLKPTIIVSQGIPPKKSLEKIAGSGYEHVRDWTSRVKVSGGPAAPVTVARVTVGNVQAVWCNLYHPALRGDYGTYFDEAGAPALRHARELALEQPPTP